MTGKDLTKLFTDSFDNGQEVDVLVFMDFIKNHNLESFVPSILNAIDWEIQEIQKNSRCIVESPFELSKENLALILQKTGADKKDLYFVENKSLVGGFRATYNQTIFDASIKNNLQKLKEHLTK